MNFYVRDCKRTKNGQAPLEISINVNGVRKFVNLPFKISPEAFNRKRKPREVLDYMASMRTRINEILADMARHGEAVTTKALVDYLKNGGYKTFSVKDLFNEFIDLQYKRATEGSITKFTYWKYCRTRDLFYTIVDSEGECEKEITNASIAKYKAVCEGKFEQATIAGYLIRLKTIVTYAIDNGHLRINPFNGVKIKKGSKPIVYLSKDEQRRLIETPIGNESLARVRDYAVIQLSTGLSYADLQALRPEDIRRNDNGTYYIEKERAKTGKVFTAVILPAGVEALKNFGYKVISNQKYNSYLKCVGDICGIKTPLTTHCFRRSYATNLLNSNVRLEVVAAALGDTIQVVKQHYAQLQRDSILNEISTKIKTGS